MIFIVSVDENAVLSCAIYDLLIIRDHIADGQFTYNEIQTMIDDLYIHRSMNCLFDAEDYLI